MLISNVDYVHRKKIRAERANHKKYRYYSHDINKIDVDYFHLSVFLVFRIHNIPPFFPVTALKPLCARILAGAMPFLDIFTVLL